MESSLELTELQKKMITPEGNLYRYIGSDIVDEFKHGDVADISFPNGYGHGCRVQKGISPALCIATIKSLIVKIEYEKIL